jgi:hypothetical protein
MGTILPPQLIRGSRFRVSSLRSQAYAYIHACMHAYIHKYMHACMHSRVGDHGLGCGKWTLGFKV